MQQKKYGVLTLAERASGLAYEVIACEKTAITAEIPEYIDGKCVIAISDYAFEKCDLLEKVSFCEGEKSVAEGVYISTPWDFCGFEIGEYAFSYCKALKGIELPEYVTTVGRGAFYRCTALEYARFSDMAFVGSYAFAGCTALTEVTSVSTVSEGVFSYCEALKDFPVTDKVTEISEDAFEHCNSFTDITVPRGVKLIEPLAFRGCASLKSVRFEETEGWYMTSVYRDGRFELDLTDPEKNAEMLARMDFDDGVAGWHRE